MSNDLPKKLLGEFEVKVKVIVKKYEVIRFMSLFESCDVFDNFWDRLVIDMRTDPA